LNILVMFFGANEAYSHFLGANWCAMTQTTCKAKSS
jgi:hypothetical protein